MRIVAGLVMLGIATSCGAAATNGPAAPVEQFIDAFNKGDTKTAGAAYAPGPIAIVDEFAPHVWIGADALQRWSADYDKHAAATGVTDGHVGHGKATRQVAEGDFGYVVVPTVYTYKERGRPIAEEGSITAAVRKVGGAWKMTAWTWTGVVPHPAK